MIVNNIEIWEDKIRGKRTLWYKKPIKIWGVDVIYRNNIKTQCYIKIIKISISFSIDIQTIIFSAINVLYNIKVFFKITKGN